MALLVLFAWGFAYDNAYVPEVVAEALNAAAEMSDEDSEAQLAVAAINAEVELTRN